MEGLGAAASIIAVASIAIQIGDSVLKLKKFVDDIKDAPEEIKMLIDETKTLGMILSTILPPDAASNPFQATSALATQCLDSCRQAANNLEKAVTELHVEMKNRKFRGGFKATLKKGTIDKLKERLSRAQMMLLMSQTLYSRMLQEHQYNIQQHQYSVQQQWFVNIQAQTSQDTVVQSHRLLPAGSASTEVQVSCSNVDHESRIIENKPSRTRQARQREHKFTIRLQGPRWFYLTSRALEITGHRSPAGWDFSTRTDIIIPRDSPVFKLAGKGDLLGLQKMFEQKEASPFVIDQYGGTLLTAAACKNHSDVGKFLLEQGVCDSPSYQSINVLVWFSVHQNKEMIKLVTPTADWSDLSNATRAKRLWFCLSYYSLNDPETLSFIHNNYEVSLPELSSAEILEGLNDTNPWRIKLHLLQFILFGRKIDSVLCQNEIFSILFGTCSLTLFHLFAFAFRNSLSEYIGGEEYTKKDHAYNTICGESVPILQQLIHGGSNLHTTVVKWERCLDCGNYHDASTTPFGGMFTGLGTKVESSRTKNLVRYWLCALQDSGVDLYEYGRREKEMSNGGTSLAVYEYGRLYGRIRLVNFTFGSAPEDWELFYTEENISTEVLEFWDMVDHPERALPGAWVEDLFEPIEFDEDGDQIFKNTPSCADIWNNFIWP
ncbi:hypothetical protein HYFRA_00012239 [Hymenoscyphus fraxineus]|uniref:Azaphilone pigments biosynthesis cluster protein L N-terminal domain-containing protein n=1 Tax=Hymenoscyphus fraxineus TaxID=746836 RepID=A0A9N9KYD4_9HELO|nr:hypothetical protein HYFRA_00012239 [Hymenoscyphus fraxineus]